MKLLFIFSIIVTVAVVLGEDEDTEAHLPEGCMHIDRSIYCTNYNSTYIPFIKEYNKTSLISINGNFKRFRVGPLYKNVEILIIRSKKLQEFPQRNLEENSEFSSQYYCDQLKSMENLTLLFVHHSNLTTFNFKCLPKSLKELSLSTNIISKITNSELMKNLTSFSYIDLSHNKLKDFDFSILPNSVKRLYLDHNNISHFKFSSFARFPSIELSIHDNPINCTCAVLFDYIKLVESDNIELRCPMQNGGYCMTCNEGSYISDYPWTKNLTSLKLTYTEQCLKKQCEIEGWSNGKYLSCEDFQQSYLPYYNEYENVTLMKIRGDFDKFAISSRFKNVENLVVDSENIEQFPLQYEDKISRIGACESLKNLAGLKVLLVSGGKLEQFHFECLPKQLTKLWAYSNQISGISESSCQALKSLSSLTYLNMKENKLQSFDFNCLPESLLQLNLNDNKITTVNFADLERLPSMRIDISNNPLNCTCEELVDLINLDQSGNSTIRFPLSFTCSRRSALAGYPLNKGISDVKEYDANYGMQCIDIDNNHETPAPIITEIEHHDAYHLTESIENDIRDSEFTDQCYIGLNDALICENIHQNYMPFLPENHNATQITITGNFTNSPLNPNRHENITISLAALQFELDRNNITDFNFSALSQFPSVEVAIHDNPIDCTCEVLLDFIKLVRSDNIELRCPMKNGGYCMTCSEGSNLSDYPWTKNLISLEEYDDNAKQCLKKQCDVPDWSDGSSLLCTDFQHSYLSYYNEYEHVTAIMVKGDFNELAISPRFKNIETLIISSKNIQHFPLRNKDQLSRSEACESLQSLTELTTLTFLKGKLTQFPFECLPKQLTQLWLPSNQISEISELSCQALRTLSSLTSLSLAQNKLQSFDFNCLPESLLQLNLNNNKITTVNFADLERLPSMRVDISKNYLDCTCTDFVALVELDQTENVNKFPWSLTCSSESELADYNWDTSISDIKHYDANGGIQCIDDGNHEKVTSTLPTEITHTDANDSTEEDNLVREFTEKCDIGINVALICKNIHQNYMPFIEKYQNVTHITITGNFTKFALHSNYTRLESITIYSVEMFPLHDNNLLGLQWDDCEALQGFNNLREFNIRNKQLREFDFGCLPRNIRKIDLSANLISNFSERSCDAMRNLSQLYYMDLSYNSLETFNFSCLPLSIEKLKLGLNRISSLESCQALKNLSSLRRIILRENRLHTFNFNCLPDNIVILDLMHNGLTDVDFNILSELSHLNHVEIYGNPLNCTCSLLFDLVNMIESTSTKVVSSLDSLFTCDGRSELIGYPWVADIARIKKHDRNAQQCYLTPDQETTISHCHVKSGTSLRCRQFPLDYLPFVEQFKYITRLYISGKFRQFSISSEYQNLEELHIHSHKMRDFPFNELDVNDESCWSLKRLTSLRKVDLSGNNLHTFDFNCFPSSMNIVKLQNNKLVNFERANFFRFSHTMVRIDGNPLHCKPTENKVSAAWLLQNCFGN